MKHLIKGYFLTRFNCYNKIECSLKAVNYKRFISFNNITNKNFPVLLSKGRHCKGIKQFSSPNDVDLHWENAEDIADLLFDEYKHVDPLALRFEELENMVIDTVVNKNKKKLNGSCNEAILENIQMNWLDRYNESNE